MTNEARPYTEEQLAVFEEHVEDLCWPIPMWVATVRALRDRANGAAGAIHQIKMCFDAGDAAEAKSITELAAARLELPRPGSPGPDVDEKAWQWSCIAMTIGYNECARQAPTLGEKVFFRILRDSAEAEFLRHGGYRIIDRPGETVLALDTSEGMPRIAFTERDIDLMRQAIAQHEACKAAEQG